MSRLALTVDLPESLIVKFVEQLRDFEKAHEGCQFDVCVEANNGTRELDSLVPPFKYRPMFRKQ